MNAGHTKFGPDWFCEVIEQHFHLTCVLSAENSGLSGRKGRWHGSGASI